MHIIPPHSWLAFDVETRGTERAYALQPWRIRTGETRITSFALAWQEMGQGESRPAYLDAGSLDPTLETLRRVLRHARVTDAPIVGWNIAFDMACLIASGLREEVFACEWRDAMLLKQHLTNRTRYDTRVQTQYGLKPSVAEMWPDRAGYGDDVNFDADTDEELQQLLAYNKLDSRYTLELAQAYWSELEPAQRNAYVIEQACLPMVAEALVEGVPADAAAAEALKTKLTRVAAATFARLRIENGDQISKEVLASPKKMAELLYDTWNLPIVKRTDQYAPSTDKEALAMLAPLDPRAALLYEHREAQNNLTKFAEGTLASLAYNGDGRVRPQARVFGTYTGRVTYSSKQGKGKAEVPTGIAIHQWKRDPEFRSIIIAPEGYTLLEHDFAGQEFRWMAVESGDHQMIALCAPGEDAHSFMGSRIACADYREFMKQVHDGDPEAKKLRQMGKVGNLSCIAEGELVLTDRGHIPIEDVSISDKVWDGVEWVNHDGLVFQGVREVITYGGVTATPDHRVLCNGEWATLEDAAGHGWEIQSALGQGWACQARSTVRILDGFVRRALHSLRRALPPVPVQVRAGEGGQPPHDGDGPIPELQKLFFKSHAPSERQACGGHFGEEAASEAGERHEATLSKSKRRQLQKLWREGNRVQVRLGEGRSRVHPLLASCIILCGLRHRSDRQQRSLRAGQPSSAEAQREHREQKTYDLLNAGRRTRFSVGSVVVSNCQYRTSAETLMKVAKVQHRIDLTRDLAYAIHGNFQTGYPGVKAYWKRQIRRAKELGWVESQDGRRIQIGRVDTWDPNLRWSYESTAINFPVQGAGAGQKYLALKLLRDYLPRVEGRFLFELHDGLFTLVPDRYAEKAAHEIKYILSNLPYQKAWGKVFPVHFPVDAKMGKTWGSLKEVA